MKLVRLFVVNLRKSLTSDDVNAVHNGTLDWLRTTASGQLGVPINMLSDTSAVRTVKTDSVHLIQEGQCTILLSKVADFFDRADTTTHRVNTLESNDLRGLLRVLRELHLEVFQVVMLEYDPLGARVTQALDHGRVVHAVGEVNAPGKLRAQGREGRVVGNVARREDERSGLAMQGRELSLEGKVHTGVTGDVPGTSRTVTIGV